MRTLVCLLLLATPGTGAIRADDPVDFVRDVRPIFERHCAACHGPQKQRSGLRLDRKASVLAGGDVHGPSIVPGQPDASPLLELVTSDDAAERMPPKGDGLSEAEIGTLRAWIARGAAWPDGIDPQERDTRREHWSFQPLAVAPGAHSIDGFVTAKLREQGLTMSPPADRVSWLRRVAFDLTGLPPAPEAVQAFVSDERPDAFERVVDRLLASPHYGERWGQHWLDVVRYADTHGFEVNTERPNAWPYRDYVIRAFNADTPYDRFVREQIVGDAMGEDAGTGFLVTASVLLPGQIGADEPSKRLARQDALDEIVTNVGQTFLGLSIGCARCHDHKFDPITARDYYGMQAFVAGIEYGDRELRSEASEAAKQRAVALKARRAEVESQLARFVPLAKSGIERPPVHARQNTDRFPPREARRVRFTIRTTNRLEPCIDELEVITPDGRNLALAAAGASVASSGDRTEPDRHELRFVNDGRYGNSRSWMSSQTGQGTLTVTLPEPQMIDRVVWGRDREGMFADRLALDYAIEVSATADGDDWQLVADATDRRPYVESATTATELTTAGLDADQAAALTALQQERQALDGQIRAAETSSLVFAGVPRAPDPIFLLPRGNPETPKDRIAPAIPALFREASGATPLSEETPEADRRRALADWVTDPANPLTVRVLANRVWQGHFGTGLVGTPNDFGHNGERPSHPELLDWLARQLLDSGGSIKHLHRRIVLSQTYRQASAPDPRAAAVDADVRLLWRYPTRRLEAETIRDAVLAVSGQLHTSMSGRGYDLFDLRGGLSGFKPVESFRGDGLKRMIYAHKVRREREAVFGAFDCPDAGQSTPRRRESTTPLQALNLFNSRFTLEQADALAARVRAEAGDDPGAQVRRAYALVLSRDPDPDEQAEAVAVVQSHGLAVLARVLFNSNAFLFVP